MKTTSLIGQRCTHSNVFSRLVLITRGLDLNHADSRFAPSPSLFSFQGAALIQLVAITAGVHPFPFRTRKLSPTVPKILVWRRTGKIGRCQHKARQLRLSRFSSLSNNPSFQEVKTWIRSYLEAKRRHRSAKTEFSQLHTAIFFKFMAANLSLTQLETRARPRCCV